jgi:hypothetical protein
MKTIKVMLSDIIGMVGILLTTTLWGNNVKHEPRKQSSQLSHEQSNMPVAIVHLPAIDIVGEKNPTPSVQ